MRTEIQPDFKPSFHCQHPAFWPGDLTTIYARVKAYQKGPVRQIATSPGGRPVFVAEYNEKQPFISKANFNSAVGARDLTAYADKTYRTRPVVMILGPVHGEETSASTGCVNLLQVLETGKDLRGKRWPELTELAQSCRLLVIPVGNPDGLARFGPGCVMNCDFYEFRYWAQGTYRDGRLCDWPECKAQHPMVGDNVGHLGAYFNDAGVNPMHDEFTAPMSTEAPAILRVAREEAPDLILGLHSHEAAPAILQPAYVPMHIKREAAEFARRVQVAFEGAGLPNSRPFAPKADGESGAIEPLNLTGALYHVSGALSMTFESPSGIAGKLQVTHEDMLDIQLTLYQEALKFAHERLNAWPAAAV
jgi:hypothetical protein